ncbi:helicase and polymerase-containing protein TEBICHI-like [Rhododendron vialii]|uniref:helicase and polymerase-containing protein TEBICHI-like n=1 Tax=Rhododendron vialii TaxID=182163 RepID=UPI00265FC775|nr:helicase and polymerase-containing protein TEBICHI-like [Rhododendron vialii]
MAIGPKHQQQLDDFQWRNLIFRYVKTLKGRSRFLAKIKLGNSKERSKAQRQAVNSICLGSAADIIKIAMINIRSLIVGEVDDSDPATVAAKFHMLRGHCRILLQVHDELVPEADPSVIKDAGWLLQMSMERAALLPVPLRVKMKVGRTWGPLEPFLAEQNEQGSYGPKFLGGVSFSDKYTG